MSGDDSTLVVSPDDLAKGAPAGLAIEKKVISSSTTYTYAKGEVCEYISNPADYVSRDIRDTSSGKEKKVSDTLYSVSNEEVGEKEVKNHLLAKHMPANSIFVYVEDKNSQALPVIAYPFFPGHISFPLKPGERVWLLKEDRGANNTFYYWMCRVCGDRQTEDLNHTNVDRGTAIRRLADEYFKTGSPVTDPELISPAVTPEKFKNSMMPRNQTVSAAQLSSISFREEVVCEPVPRTFGKCSDFLIQGSNNSTIQLTTEKFRKREDIAVQAFLSNDGDPDGGNVHTPLAGTIDMFVGKEKERLKALSEASDPEALNTSGELNVKKSRRLQGAQKFETYEISKIDEYETGEENTLEGNDSPRNVYSRLYLGMNTTPDESFEFSNSDFAPGDTDLTGDPRHAVGSSAVLYSDHIRSYAEKSLRLHVYPPESSIETVSNPGGALLDISNDGTITLQSGEGVMASKIILRSDGNIIIKPGLNGLLHLGGDETETSGIAVSVAKNPNLTTSGFVLPNIPSHTDTFGGTSFLGDPTSGFTSSKVVIKV